MAKIIAPNSKFNGKRAGIAFVDGVAHTDDEGAARYFAKHGYKVEGKPKKAPRTQSAPKVHDEATDPFAAFTVEQLRTYAADNGIDLGDATKKDDIKAAILAGAAAVADEVPEADSVDD